MSSTVHTSTVLHAVIEPLLDITETWHTVSLRQHMYIKSLLLTVRLLTLFTKAPPVCGLGCTSTLLPAGLAAAVLLFMLLVLLLLLALLLLLTMPGATTAAQALAGAAAGCPLALGCCSTAAGAPLLLGAAAAAGVGEGVGPLPRPALLLMLGPPLPGFAAAGPVSAQFME
jgi:hypothetical protein